MAVIASAELDLNVVNDAYTVSLTNPICAVHADFDGANPQLANAYTEVTVSRGDVSVPFVLSVASQTPEGVSVSVSSEGQYKYRVGLVSIPTTDLEGTIVLSVQTEDGYGTTITWGYTVLRETSMLDWILDWDSTKTKIGDSYVITPKLFVGYKNDDGTVDAGKLTGVYIGPDSIVGGTASVGLYGYKNGTEVFHLNESGGSIGGWNIEEGGLFTTAGNLKILSSGTIEAIDSDSQVLWGIYESGEATFAKGNVVLKADGSASFTGTINASSGTIGGWTITSASLYNNVLGLSASDCTIAITAGNTLASAEGVVQYKASVVKYGGVMMYYTSVSDYGIVGYVPDATSTMKTFSVGSSNQIAGWNFDDAALWTGTRNNTARQYATSGITLGTNGLRGLNFYIDASGEAKFAKGAFTIAANGAAQISGWSLSQDMLQGDYGALVSSQDHSGLYLFDYQVGAIDYDIYDYPSALESYNGIGLYYQDGVTELVAYQDQQLLFRLSNTNFNQIAAWKFVDTALYIGDSFTDEKGKYTSKSGAITLGSQGIRGYQWRIEADGSGSVAGGAITWTSNSLTLDESVKLSASSIVSGTLDATKITSDTIISNGDAWALNKDGGGYLANGNITWESDGSGTLAGGQIRWDEDGTAYFNGVIANGVAIGDHFTLKTDGLWGMDNNTSAEYAVNLFYNGLHLIQYDQLYSCTKDIHIGTDWSPSNGNGEMSLVDLSDPRATVKEVLRINATGATSTPTNGVMGNCAINLDAGYVRGYCAATQFIYGVDGTLTSATVTRGINVVYLTTPINFQLTLPALTQASDDGYVVVLMARLINKTNSSRTLTLLNSAGDTVDTWSFTTYSTAGLTQKWTLVWHYYSTYERTYYDITDDSVVGAWFILSVE